MFVREELAGPGGGRDDLTSLLEWQETQSGKFILALGKNFLTIRFVSRAISYWEDSKIKSSNKIFNNYLYGAVYVGFNVKAES